MSTSQARLDTATIQSQNSTVQDALLKTFGVFPVVVGQSDFSADQERCVAAVCDAEVIRRHNCSRHNESVFGQVLTCCC